MGRLCRRAVAERHSRGSDPPERRARLGSELASELAAIERLAGNPRVRAVGETGLDFYRTRDAAGHAAQRESFAAHIAFAKAKDKTLVIHDRDAHAEILGMLDTRAHRVGW